MRYSGTGKPRVGQRAATWAENEEDVDVEEGDLGVEFDAVVVVVVSCMSSSLVSVSLAATMSPPFPFASFFIIFFLMPPFSSVSGHKPCSLNHSTASLAACCLANFFDA